MIENVTLLTIYQFYIDWYKHLMLCIRTLINALFTTNMLDSECHSSSLTWTDNQFIDIPDTMQRDDIHVRTVPRYLIIDLFLQIIAKNYWSEFNAFMSIEIFLLRLMKVIKCIYHSTWNNKIAKLKCFQSLKIL